MPKRILFLVLAVALSAGRAEARSVRFSGKADLNSGSVEVEFLAEGDSKATVRFRPVSGQEYQILARFNNWRTRFFEISTDLEGSLILPPGQAGGQNRYLMKMRSRYTIINAKPAEDFLGQFELRGKTLLIHTLSAGPFFLQGDVDILPPYRLDLDLKFSQLALSDVVRVLALALPADGNADAEGAVNGRIHFSGALDRLRYTGEAESYDGTIAALVYRYFDLKVDGLYPALRIHDSQVSQTDGFSFRLSGALDLSHLETLGQQIDRLRKDPLIKSTPMETEWTLKRLESDDRSGTTELKYLRRSKENVNTMSEEDSDLLGVEQKIKF